MPAEIYVVTNGTGVLNKSGEFEKIVEKKTTIGNVENIKYFPQKYQKR